MFDLSKLSEANVDRASVYVPQDLWMPFMEACEQLNIQWCTNESATQVCDRIDQMSEPKGQTIHLNSWCGRMTRTPGHELNSTHCEQLMLTHRLSPVQPDDLAAMLMMKGGCYD